jgi:hypothetical protein
MTPKKSTTALILATFALVGVMTTGAIVPAAFAQTTDDPFTGTGGLLDQFLGGDGLTDGNGAGNSITDEAETAEETTEQTLNQSENSDQSNSIDQDQTAAINEEIASGEDSEAASAANSDSESTYEAKYKSKHGSTPYIPGTSTSTSDSASDIFNTGAIEQEQTLSSPVQVNSNEAGDDESRSAVVGFDLGFEQFTEQDSAVPGVGTSVPIVIPR